MAIHLRLGPIRRGRLNSEGRVSSENRLRRLQVPACCSVPGRSYDDGRAVPGDPPRSQPQPEHKCAAFISIQGSAISGNNATAGANARYFRSEAARLGCSPVGSPVKGTILTFRKKMSVSSRHIPAPMSNWLNVAGKVRSCGGAKMRNAAQAPRVITNPHESTQVLAACNCSMAA